MTDTCMADTCMADTCMADTCMSDTCSTPASDTPKRPSHARVTWTSEAQEPQPVLLRDACPDEPCAMFQMPIADVCVDGLGPFYLEDTEPQSAPTAYSTAELACGHAFHAAALAIHFVTNDMRCPVCRRGPLHTANISSLAPAMHDNLTRVKLAMHTRAFAEQAQETFGVDVNLEALLRDFLFEIYMQWAPAGRAEATARCDAVARLTSPLRLVLPETPAENTTNTANTENTANTQQQTSADTYATHRSFQRKFNINLGLMHSGQNVMCLGLTHPLMPDAARTPMFDKAALLAAADSRSRIALARNIGYVEPVHSDAGIVLTLYLNTSYVSLILVQQMLNWEQQLRV